MAFKITSMYPNKSQWQYNKIVIQKLLKAICYFCFSMFVVKASFQSLPFYQLLPFLIYFFSEFFGKKISILLN